MAGPLTQATRVLDLSERSPAAAIAAMVLADLGAEVIRVEPPGGDPLRALSGARVWLRGQRSVVVGDAEMRSGAWLALRDSADVIIDTAHPWIDKPTGLLDGATPGPRQILAVLSAYPRTIAELAHAGSGLNPPVCGELIEAQYGMQNFQQGVRPEGPHFLGWPHAIYGAAWMLQIGILGALYHRARSGEGQTVTTSLLDGAAILSNARWLGGKNLGPMLLTGSRITTRPSNLRLIVGLFQCSDGYWIQVHTGPRGAFDRMLKVVGREDLIVENAGVHILATPLAPAVVADLWGYLDDFFKTKPSSHWCEALAQADVCCMPALKPGEALWLEQMEANGLVDIAADGARMLGRLAKYSRSTIELRREAPSCGQDNATLLTDRGAAANGAKPAIVSSVARKIATADSPAIGPLDGILVLDFGAYMAGPFANRLFADLGARVIKVEEYGGDPMRGPQLGSFLGVQRGKESIAVDLKSSEGRRIAHDLARRADVVHHNLRAGAMERLGVGWEDLRTLNPRLIYCHSSGYGNAGPWAKLPTFEPLHSALTGMLVRTGGDGNPPDHYLTHMDYGCGLTSCAMVLAALVEREQSGVGQYLEVPQTGAGLFAMSDVHGSAQRKVETFPLDREQRGHSPANALYRTADGWVVIACYSEREWLGVCRALGLDLARWPSYVETRQQRLEASPSATLIESAMSTLSTASALRRLRAEQVPAASPAPFTPAEINSEPTLTSRGVIVTEEHFDAGEVTEVGHTVRFSNANRWNLRAAPVTGQHSVAILRELGRGEAEIAHLVERKIVNAGRVAQASPELTKPA
ncbi:MAG TPA: CoA transferase [Candidatus Binataceae bacterium]|nr:CoA transferase [Candidatus Binataceae bacterium]